MPEFSVKRGLQQFQATWILNSVFVDMYHIGCIVDLEPYFKIKGGECKQT